MYYPYFRGKQYELVTVRETARVLASSRFVPIIEPVKESLGGLQRALDAVSNEGGTSITIVNPYHGDHVADGDGIAQLLRDKLPNTPGILAGVLLKRGMTSAEALAICAEYADERLALIHAGFSDPRQLSADLGDRSQKMQHIFIEDDCGKLYLKYFRRANRILLRDGFRRRRNRDHPQLETFSDLHVTYEEEGMNGFGDFLVVGDEYSETGGPAYAVAIHLTFIDPARDNAMFIYHFVSTRQDTPTDPAGKFGEALDALMRKLNDPNVPIFPSSSVREFRELYQKSHFPGLGYIKKLSMNHHIETLADYLT